MARIFFTATTTVSRRGFGVVLPALLVAVGCYEPPANSTDAVIDSANTEPDGCSAAVCVDGSMLNNCGQLQACALGCISTGVPHCATLVASNGVTEADWSTAAGAQSIQLDQAVIINTMTGQILSMIGQVREPGEGVRNGIGWRSTGSASIFMVNKLTVSNQVGFSGNLPVIIVSANDVLIDGLIDVGPVAGAPVAGGFPGGQVVGQDGSGCGAGRGGKSVSSSDAGGGGAGYGGPGAPGASAQLAVGGLEGTQCGDSALEPLQGGSGGGAGGLGNEPTTMVSHGAGGGALQLSSRGVIQLTAQGVINAPGGGGHPGPVVNSTGGGGGGGGAGGAILIEAMELRNDGGLFANGGGGGGAGSGGIGPGRIGERGRGSTSAAAGGASAAEAGIGGSGATAQTAAVSPPAPTASTNAGGGGGAVGRISVRASSIATGVASPTPVVLPVRSQ